MWESKGHVRSIGLILLIIGNLLAGHGLDLSTLPTILESLGMGIGVIGIINKLLNKK